MHEMIEVTSLNRPDTSWRAVDDHGHEHRWYVNGQPAQSYSPMNRYQLPTLTLVVDYPATDDYPAITHYECKLCGEHIRPGRCADTSPQFIRGFSY